MWKLRSVLLFTQSGFQAPPPQSRPPTKEYDRQSFVLVVHENEDVQKFMKMHLNRYFSHVVVASGMCQET